MRKDSLSVTGSQGVITDNEEKYLMFLRDCIEHADPDAIIEITKREDRIDAVIKPSIEEFKPALIYNLLGGHRILNLTIRFSKSLAAQKIITYSLFYQE